MKNKIFIFRSIGFKFLLTVHAFLFIFVVLAFGVERGGSAEETPLALPKSEGSKSFDMEINQINRQGLKLFKQNNFNEAVSQFDKALNLAISLRDPARGILHYNLALTLHHAGNHKEALEQFYEARRWARGYKKILNSKLFKMHECGLNPSVTCETPVPLELNIEGSH